MKDLITYFRELQKCYDVRSKSFYSLGSCLSNLTTPPQLASVGDALQIFRDYHKQAISESNKSKSIEEDIIVQLTGLRSDLGQKIKEIKGLSGDFKNNVERETEGTRRCVRDLHEALSSTDPKIDPYLTRLAVDRQVGKQVGKLEHSYPFSGFLRDMYDMLMVQRIKSVSEAVT